MDKLPKNNWVSRSFKKRVKISEGEEVMLNDEKFGPENDFEEFLKLNKPDGNLKNILINQVLG